ncbi:2Fe-2S iron-sulfur cluster-binding protein [Brucella intermedia]|uniref:Oxidoreductase FAD-binding subunit n=1 Tax=Brucella intermedia M86 TaxID=1234597 RepID=M5K5P0_9HYPH|nr:2Fe-2S iron-sulfur cluster-binding protein [Brucella intermedia]ELT51231.1 oxidoreductase FAD-binding subunit [Brucella intermedia M86]
MTNKRIEIRQARTAIDVAEGQTILEAALDLGIPYPHGCRSGRCGSCKSRLITGDVELLPHSRFALSETEKADGLILACRAVPKTDGAVAWLGDDDELANLPVRFIDATVASIEDATHDIKVLRIVSKDLASVEFAAGQYAQLKFAGLPVRSYSMANRPGDDALEFHVRRVPGGATSTYIHEQVRPGDHVAIEVPLGSSYLRQNHAGPILCIAGGSGLAPIKSIVETALVHGARQPIHVYFGVREERDLYLLDHFAALEASHPNLRFTPVLSEARGPTSFRTGYVAAVVGEDLTDFDGWKAYVAGPPLMVDSAMEMARARGLRQQDMHVDVFFTPEDA